MLTTKHSAIVLVLVVTFLVTLGGVMLFSSSAFATKAGVDPYFYFSRQMIALIIGIGGAAVAATVNCQKLEKYAPWILAAACLLLLLCLVPGIGVKANGARRWFRLLGFSFQPAEAAKLAVIIFMAWWLSRHQRNVGTWNWGFAFPLAAVCVPVGLILLQPDLGTGALIVAVALAVLFIAGSPLKLLVPCAVGFPAALVAFAMMFMPERRERILTWIASLFHPERMDKTGDGYQVWQALIALGSGGLEGLGLGNSRQKMKYLPEAHTDFIFPVIGEELGVFWTLAIVFGFLLLCVAGFMISLNAKDRFSTYLGLGVTLMLGLQAAINIGVVTATIPNKGMPLPFISYGGTNLIVCLTGVGLLLNVYRHANFVPEHDPLALGEYTPKL